MILAGVLATQIFLLLSHHQCYQCLNQPQKQQKSNIHVAEKNLSEHSHIFCKKTQALNGRYFKGQL